ncbi:teichoic acid biosynthesis protein A [Listeria floridensis FSL S10-1187]|uniref:N-acetylglucosaminyldiphosphoundecaprenol N-acetyl-beta-D-mannosaminyltransferase n=1 Tax=Listeria floridensis FSL S10-1187 TaxID=1265817 RepID=A0ABN0RFW6_9LIST|nr:WecB/TagA/CpsF family glycosyltransferase [Listeria floridensis]EUJ32699.1 teichoic acid biosynthesis protein A [Listeria floridensis FSL S10-1187]
MENKTVDILDIPFYRTTQERFIDELLRDAENEYRRFVVTANPEIVMSAKNDIEFKKVVQQADYITADGIGIIMAAEKLGLPLSERVTGFDTMIGILKQAADKKMKIFFLGAKPEVSKALPVMLSKNYPELEVVGCRHGYFTEEENEAIVAEIQAGEPDFIFVALGSPTQEKWIESHLSAFSKGIFMGVGGSFDILSGTVKRAPKIMIKLRLEWLYRIATNPSRWRRFLALPRFFACCESRKKAA